MKNGFINLIWSKQCFASPLEGLATEAKSSCILQQQKASSRTLVDLYGYYDLAFDSRTKQLSEYRSKYVSESSLPIG